VERPTVVIISDEPEFSKAATRRWLTEPNVPSFIVLESSSSSALGRGGFDLAVIGGVAVGSIAEILKTIEPAGKPVIHVSRPNGHSPRSSTLLSLPEIQQWPDLLVTLGSQVLERERASAEFTMFRESWSRIEQQATLGRYMLEVRHNLNNALTSILGNSDLILLDQDELSPTTRAQLETIRNMGMRMNEILQRFSSLQKEMELIESTRTPRSKRACAGI
jgi:signal transduction histidine kinase